MDLMLFTSVSLQMLHYIDNCYVTCAILVASHLAKWLWFCFLYVQCTLLSPEYSRISCIQHYSAISLAVQQEFSTSIKFTTRKFIILDNILYIHLTSLYCMPRCDQECVISALGVAANLILPSYVAMNYVDESINGASNKFQATDQVFLYASYTSTDQIHWVHKCKYIRIYQFNTCI